MPNALLFRTLMFVIICFLTVSNPGASGSLNGHRCVPCGRHFSCELNLSSCRARDHGVRKVDPRGVVRGATVLEATSGFLGPWTLVMTVAPCIGRGVRAYTTTVKVFPSVGAVTLKGHSTNPSGNTLQDNREHQ